MKLLVSEYEVTLVNDSSHNEFFVKLNGPVNSPYEGVSTSLFDKDVGPLDSPSALTGTIPVQITFDRLREQNLPP